MKIKNFENFLNENKREKITLGGNEMWLDRDRSILFDNEN